MISGRHVMSLAQPRRRRYGIRGQVLLPAFAALAVALLTLATPRNMDAVTKRATILTAQVPAALDLGVHPVVTVRLTADGSAVPGETVSVKIGDQVTKQVTTGPTGTATVSITRDLSAGTYRFSATFAGSDTYRSAASSTVTLTVHPAVLAVATVPSMPNMPLLIAGGGAVVKTGADGIALVSVSTIGPLTLKLALPADTPMERIRLDRWDDGSTEATRTIRIPDIRQVTVALQFLHPVQFTFKTPTLVPIANSLIPFVDISDDAGNVTRLTGPAPYWIEANAITRLATGFSSAVPEYRIVSVQLDGSEVVNRGQQRFTADMAKTIPVELLVFDLAIQGRDALLKSSAGFKATVTSTDGVKYFVELDSSGRASVRLPRGEYRILLGNGIGIPLSTPVALSRDQGVDVLFVTPLDIGLFIGAGLLGAFALVVIGRPHVLRWRSLFDRVGLTARAHFRMPRRPGGPGKTSRTEATMAGVPAATPTLSWADPAARLSAPERTQRPKEISPVPVGFGGAAQVADSPGDRKIARRARTRRPPTTAPAAMPKPRAGAKPVTTPKPNAGRRPTPTPKPGAAPKPAATPNRTATSKPGVGHEPAATPNRPTPKRATTLKPAAASNVATTPKPRAARSAPSPKAPTGSTPPAASALPVPVKRQAAQRIAILRAAPLEKPASRRPVTTRRATAPIAPAPGTHQAPVPVLKQATTSKRSAKPKVDATPQRVKPATPGMEATPKAEGVVRSSVVSKSRKSTTIVPAAPMTAKPVTPELRAAKPPSGKPEATLRPGKPTKPGKTQAKVEPAKPQVKAEPRELRAKPEAAAKPGKSPKPRKPVKVTLASPTPASTSTPRRLSNPMATAKAAKATKPAAPAKPRKGRKAGA